MQTSINKNIAFLPATYDLMFHGPVEKNNFLYRMPYRALGNTGLNVSLLSYGGSSLGQFYGDEINQKSIDAIRHSIKSGVNYIDTSPWYGESEKLIGEALKCVPRNTYYIGTKVGRNCTPGWENRFDFTGPAVLKNVENSLKLLGLSYVDIIQIHDVEFCLDPQVLITETLPALESIVRAGKARFIGITGYDLKVLKQIVEISPVKIDTILSYSRMNFHDTTLLDFVSFFESKKVGIINASPVAMGLYTTRGPPEWHPASNAVKSAAKSAIKTLQSQKMRIEDASLGFSLHPEPLAISSTLVGMPNDEVLRHNLEIVTTPRTATDKKLYHKLKETFKSQVKGPAHWEGKEIDEYKKAIGIVGKLEKVK